MIPGKIPATPPLANREFLQRGAGSRCGVVDTQRLRPGAVRLAEHATLRQSRFGY
jgi:hypothetical protein